MPYVDREGIFKVAAGSSHALEQPEGKKSVAVVLKSTITDKLEGNDWQPWPYGHEVYTRLWLIKSDGTVHEHAVKTLRDVLGWDGDLESIGGDGWQIPAFQVTVKADTYNGQTRFRGEWINPVDYVPSSRPRSAPPETVSTLKAQYGSAIRALYGTRPAPAPAPSAPPPAPAKATTLPPPPAKPLGVHGTKARAWNAFLEAAAAFPTPLDDADLGKQWLRIYSDFFGDTPEESLTPKDWLRMEQEGPGRLIPF